MFVTTKGGPLFGMTTIVYYRYQMGLNMLRLGYVTVVAFILFVVIFVLSLIQRWYLGKEVSYYSCKQRLTALRLRPLNAPNLQTMAT